MKKKKLNISVSDEVYDIVYGDCRVLELNDDRFKVMVDKTKQTIEFNKYGSPINSITGVRTIFYSKSEAITSMASISLLDIECMFCELNEFMKNKDYYVVTKANNSLDSLLDDEFEYTSDAVKFIINNQGTMKQDYEIWSLDENENLIGFSSKADYEKVVYKLLDKALPEYVKLVESKVLADVFHIVEKCGDIIKKQIKTKGEIMI